MSEERRLSPLTPHLTSVTRSSFFKDLSSSFTVFFAHEHCQTREIHEGSSERYEQRCTDLSLTIFDVNLSPSGENETVLYNVDKSVGICIVELRPITNEGITEAYAPTNFYLYIMRKLVI